VTLILFTTRAPNTLTDEFARQGHEVYEALAISEVLSLAEQYPTASIIITPEVEQSRASVIQQHWPTVHLHRQFVPLGVSIN
jgi:hypothetical protein